MKPDQDGRLVVVGTGIRAIAHLTQEAEGAIRDSDRVFYLVQDIVTERAVRGMNPNSESLLGLYEPGRSRLETYEAIVETALQHVRTGHSVCVALYGHPGVFANPGHEAIRRARAEGYPAEMLPGVSSIDCLFSDLGFDPGVRGLQSFEATDFLIRGRCFDPSSHLILWQIGAIGVPDFRDDECWNQAGVAVLAGLLAKTYGYDHLVVVYEAPVYALDVPVEERVSLRDLGESKITLASTLYVPPIEDRPVDMELLARLRSTA